MLWTPKFGDLTDVTLTLESVTSKLVDVVAFADIEESVHDRLVTADSLATVGHVQ